MAVERFKLIAEISTSDPLMIESVLSRLIGVNGMIRTDSGFKIRTTFLGTSAERLNRALLSNLRRVDKNTTMRSEWISSESTERFINYVAEHVM